MTVLAFDVATATGWACSDGTSGVLNLGIHADYRARGWMLIEAVGRMIAEHAPDLVVIERPFGARASSYLLDGLVFAVHAVCHGLGVPSSEVRADDWRRGLGLPCRGDRKALKAAALTYARERGHDPRTDDEADALCILFWAERMPAAAEKPARKTRRKTKILEPA